MHAALRLLGFGFALLLVVGRPGAARADVASPVDADQGLVVVGVGSSMDVVWPLARAVYADASLRPAKLDEAHARVLAGENAPGEATAELRDLADSRAAIHGDDAASRRLLQSIGTSFHAKGVIVVDAPAAPTGRPTARVFMTPHGSPGAFDAAVYEADAPPPVTWGNGSASVAWTGAVEALRRGFAVAAPAPPAAPAVAASPLALHPVAALAPGTVVDGGAKGSRPFYKSPWFWAAAAGAAFAATAVYFATRNDGSDNIQLQVQVPK